MSFALASRRSTGASRTKRFGPHQALDLTSRAPDPWVRFSPFFPHGGIPVPFTPGTQAASVEGIWQGLKVFASTDVDERVMHLTTMKGLKRTTRRHGAVLGHRAGLAGTKLLPYREARREIYLPTYRWVLEHRLQPELAQLRALGANQRVVLLDYETNDDEDDLSKPLSHAGLVARYLEDTWPTPPPPPLGARGTIRTVRGDATAFTGAGARVLVHVCNDLGKWGRGFTRPLSKRWPELERRFRSWHAGGEPQSGAFRLSAVQIVPLGDEAWVLNLVGQHGLKGQGSRQPVRYWAIRAGLRQAAEFARDRGATLHMPRIGCGLAGGRWDVIHTLLEEEVLSQGIDVLVYELPR